MTLDFLASFRLRILFRSAFLLLALAVVAMAVTVLQEEKQRSYDNYQAGFNKTKEQIAARLHHPSGQLALLNPPRGNDSAAPLHPVLLPFAAIDFDDQTKVHNAVEMAGCLVQYKHDASLCVAIGNSAWAGGFIYAAGTFASVELVPHRIGDEVLDTATRLRVTVQVRGQTTRWIAPFEPLAPGTTPSEAVRGRFTGYLERPATEGVRNYKGAQPVKEFRGWVWQGNKCLDGSPLPPPIPRPAPAEAAAETGAAAGAETSKASSPAPAETPTAATPPAEAACPRKSFFSLRLPVDALRDALFQRGKPQWPPADLDQFRVHIEALPPGDGPALFDSDEEGAMPPFSLNDLAGLLLPGESLAIRRAGQDKDIFVTAGRDESGEQSSPLLTRLIRTLPVESYDTPVELKDEVATPVGNYQLLLKGDARSVNKTLSAVASRVSWFVGAMLLAIGLAWLVIEIGIIRRIAELTRRTRGLSRNVHAEADLQRYDLADLRGSDELGILATGLNDLLRRVKEDAERERIRAEQEKDLWHAVGHEIMSPLQSLLALHGSSDDPSYRYISRMQQAVRVLYGSASPSEAFETAGVQVQRVDVAAFLRHVAANAGFDQVIVTGSDGPVFVRADEYPLEDVFAHLLKNADRYRPAGTPITLNLAADDNTATITVHNHGPQIATELLDKIFEYGVSDQPDAAAQGNRGQGLFVAKTYMAKMGGTISVRNEVEGVSFILTLSAIPNA